MKLRRSCAIDGRRFTALALLALPLLSAPLGAQQGSAAIQAPPTLTLHTGTDIVIVDVVVTDANGHPIRGLKSSDFTLSEDHVSQHIKNFAEHSTPPAGRTTAAPEAKLAPGLFTNYSGVSQDGPSNVLLLDMLNTPLRDQAYARQQIQDFLNHAPAGTQIAIFGLSDRLTILQGFTSDPAILKAALASKGAGRASSLLNDATGGGGNDNGGATGLSDSLQSLGQTPDIQEAVANAQQFEADVQSYQLQVRSEITLDAMNELGRYLANIPGRKNLIWFSGSFPVSVLADPTTNNGFASMTSSEAEFHETMNLLARGQVSLYPVDARGLMTTGNFTASSTGMRYGRDATAPGKDLSKFDLQTASENGTMLAAAQDTGGEAFVNTNGLAGAVAKAIDEGSNYYTLTFTPANRKWNGAYRRLVVTVPGKPYTLSYRRGYYADDPDAPGAAPKHEASAAAPPNAAETSLITRSMVRGAPVPTQIQFTVRVLPETGAAEPAAFAGNSPTAAAHGAFMRYAVDFAINPQDFSFRQSDGAFHDAIEFVTFVYTRDGTIVNRLGTTLHADFKSDVYQQFLHRPFSYNEDVSVPREGSYFLRIAVHDLNTERIGAVEIPVDSVKNLEPLSAVEKPQTGK